MELNDILTLVKAGYTREEIDKMGQPLAEPTSVDTPAQDSEPVPAQVAEPVAVADAVPEQKEEQPTMQDILKSIAKLTSAVQANAISQSVLPEGMRNQPTAEDMLAEIIRPTYKERR